MNDYFKENQVVITQIPDKYRIVGEKGFPNLTIKSARQLYEHIEKEEAFWTNDVVKTNSEVASYPNQIKSAKDSFEIALESKDQATGKTILKGAIDNIRKCTISSTTRLAKIFANYSMETIYFFQGFDKAVTDTSLHLQSLGQYQLQFLKGFIVGLEYKKVISDLYSGMVGEEMTNFSNAADNATEKISEIMVRADNDYEDQNQKHLDLLEAKKKEYNLLEKDFADFVEFCHAEKEAIEKTYDAHLKLAKPAEYWAQMETKYNDNGKLWLTWTIRVAVIAVILLIAMILLLNPFDLNEWVDGIRTTVLITTLITIFTFIIRFTSKMATSSFHLARDAKEREQLSYFYLALIRGGAVQESERHLVISSLFSRADTGLLKGDSSPEMPPGSGATEKFTKS